MSDDSPESIHKSIRAYMMVFGALAIGTVVTVLAYFIHFDSMVMTVAVALLIATVKASLVAAVFMHLAHEKHLIYRFLVPTVFFFGAMMFLIVWALLDIPAGSSFQ